MSLMLYHAIEKALLVNLWPLLDKAELLLGDLAMVHVKFAG
jgi:hypothetical protein